MAGMWNRAPLALAVGLFVLGAFGLLATAADPWETTSYLGITWNDPTPAPPDMRSVQAPVLPGVLPLAAPTATIHTTSEAVSPGAAAPSPEQPAPTATPTPRPPLFIGALSSDEAHELGTPTPGPVRILMVGRDDPANSTAVADATSEASVTPAVNSTPEATTTPVDSQTPEGTPAP